MNKILRISTPIMLKPMLMPGMKELNNYNRRASFSNPNETSLEAISRMNCSKEYASINHISREIVDMNNLVASPEPDDTDMPDLILDSEEILEPLDPIEQTASTKRLKRQWENTDYGGIYHNSNYKTKPLHTVKESEEDEKEKLHMTCYYNHYLEKSQIYYNHKKLLKSLQNIIYIYDDTLDMLPNIRKHMEDSIQENITRMNELDVEIKKLKKLEKENRKNLNEPLVLPPLKKLRLSETESIAMFPKDI